MTEYVIDASVATKWVVQGEPHRNRARALLRDAIADGIYLIGPPLLEYEVESDLQRRLYHRRASVSVVDESLRSFYAIGVEIVDDGDVVERARDIARRFAQERIYDAVYAALADLRGCDFWTADKRFYDAVQADLPLVRYLPDYA